MPQFLNSLAPDFEAQFTALLSAKRETSAEVGDAVDVILADIRQNGDEALTALTKKYDGMALTPAQMAITSDEISAEIAKVLPHEHEALKLAADRIRAYHEKQRPEDLWWQDDTGAELGWRWTAVETAGLYVPGGLASYPSSVLMNAIAAQVAGVDRLIMCCPTPSGVINPLVLAAADLSGVDQVFRVGGAQAIAAMAYGTSMIPKVDVITGPGNAYVAAAKARVYGAVGIDMIAGPSEILVIADRHNDPDWIALDLLSQAEHDESAQSILITDSADFGIAVGDAVEARLKTLDRKDIAGPSWRDNGAIITVRDLDEAVTLSDRLAPEHLEICTHDAEVISRKIRHAGAIFIGAYTPEAIGDYVGGPNHVLPTARSARFASGLSVLDFMKRTTLAKMSPAALASIGPAAETLAKSESLQAHGLSVRARLNRLNEG
ncbi:MAG: histidinol dehydrogenase [Pseudomonadota bacterium]